MRTIIKEAMMPRGKGSKAGVFLHEETGIEIEYFFDSKNLLFWASYNSTWYSDVDARALRRKILELVERHSDIKWVKIIKVRVSSFSDYSVERYQLAKSDEDRTMRRGWDGGSVRPTYSYIDIDNLPIMKKQSYGRSRELFVRYSDQLWEKYEKLVAVKDLFYNLTVDCVTSQAMGHLFTAVDEIYPILKEYQLVKEKEK